ncbi:AIPR family protein [Kerstersia gyiorum]|uniref:AIPR family protein n=1 Tax=Kerstersia gyiorum TaxID=206506 RepID=UPI00214F8043|nr:AIPR family protein [Kerstersia gyiorum]MCR4158010.1 AIPR family protein [Kerstersia gyiorum]
MLDITYPRILDILAPHLVPKRSESASFLIWYFENYLRLDSLDAVDCICDQSGDKGIDGIYLNTDANVIEIYQSKLFQKAGAVVGDKLLREFQGSLSQFETPESLNNLVDTAGDAEVGRLITRMELQRRVSEFDVVGYFVCNGELDANGRAFLEGAPRIRFIGKSELEASYVPAERALPVTAPMSFSISGYDVAEYIVDADHRAVIAPIMASELVQMDGIANQTVFAFNVRGSLGRTQVNRDIARSIADQSSHKRFPLFHNGITVVAEKVESSADSIDVQNYFVVNGCQSLNALFQGKQNLTDNLRILTKFIQASPTSPLAEMITRFSNNQNGVKARDFKSNNQIQIRLQNEFANIYGAEFFFEIKRGENSGALMVISNELAGQYLMAWDLKQPWATHRKYQIFEDKHSDLFGRPDVTADRIVLCHVLAGCIDKQTSSIKNQLFAKYDLTRFFLLYVLRLIIEGDDSAVDVISHPAKYTRDVRTRNTLALVINELLSEAVTDLNAEINQLEDNFDYRGRLRDEKWCKDLAHEIATTHEKLVNRGRLDNFASMINRHQDVQ